jgi:hypothetical protein
MATKIQIRRDTAANWTSVNPTLSNGEFGYETDTNKLKIGDGSTAYNSLSYFVPGTLGDVSDVDGTSTTGQVLTAQADGSYAFDTPFDGAYSSLTGAPTNVSDFTNDSGFITTYTVTESDVTTHQAALSLTENQISDLQTYLTTVALNDVSDVSTASATTGQVLTVQADGSFAFEDAATAGASALGDLTDVDDTSATEGQVLTVQSDGSYAFADSAGGTVYQNTYVFTATASQTEFSGGDDNGMLLDFTAGQAIVFLNGVLLVPTTDYTEGTDTITLTSAATAGDIIIISTWELSQPVSAWTFQGSNYGYTSGGGFPAKNVIQKYSFSTDGNATDVGDLLSGSYSLAGASSADYGYVFGGNPTSNVIQKFLFSTDGNATDVADLTQALYGAASQTSADYGYVSGGYSPTNLDIIHKFSFSTEGNATDIGNLTVARRFGAGQSSTDYGYTSGGYGTGYSNVIDKFSFSTDGDATDVGDLVAATSGAAGQSSTDYGYVSGGAANSSSISKFSFASDGNASSVGSLTGSRSGSCGTSSTDYGYSSGSSSLQTMGNVIDKFPFATDANATDVGDLTIAVGYTPAGNQY